MKSVKIWLVNSILKLLIFFYIAIDYLRKWSPVMGHVDIWCVVWYRKHIILLKNKKAQLSEAEVFDQSVCLKTFVSTNLGAEECESTNMQDKWLKFFQTVNIWNNIQNYLKSANIFSLCLHTMLMRSACSLWWQRSGLTREIVWVQIQLRAYCNVITTSTWHVPNFTITSRLIHLCWQL
jgi:hypothetical protein